MKTKRRPNPVRLSICAIEDCNRQAVARTLCKKHYYYARRKNVIPDKYVNERHGKVNTPEYRSWYSLKTRVSNPKDKRYHRYGGRGITVCEGIKNSFTYFLKIVGVKSSPDLSIDRVDNNKGYWCGQCEDCKNKKQSLNLRWATKHEQSLNRGKWYVCSA